MKNKNVCKGKGNIKTIDMLKCNMLNGQSRRDQQSFPSI